MKITGTVVFQQGNIPEKRSSLTICKAASLGGGFVLGKESRDFHKEPVTQTTFFTKGKLSVNLRTTEIIDQESA